MITSWHYFLLSSLHFLSQGLAVHTQASWNFYYAASKDNVAWLLLIYLEWKVAAAWNCNSKIETKRADTRCWRHASFVRVIYEKVWGYISTVMHFMGGGGGHPNPQPPTFTLRLWPRNMQEFKTKTVRHLPSLTSCEVLLRAWQSKECSTSEIPLTVPKFNEALPLKKLKCHLIQFFTFMFFEEVSKAGNHLHHVVVLQDMWNLVVAAH